MSERIGIGILGCGKQAVKHITALRYLDVRMVLADVDEDHASQMASEFGIEWAPSAADLLEDKDILAVDICTPTASHFGLIERALDAGKHFFCEKPLVMTKEEAQRVQQHLEKSGQVGMVGYLYRFHPAMEMVRNLILDGTIGRPYFATFRLGGRGSHKAWKHQKESGGGAVNEMMVHMLDLVLWYFGPVSRLETILWDIVLPERSIEGEKVRVDAEDLAMVYLESAGGVKVICESDLITPSYMNFIEVQAQNGSIITSILDYFPSLVYCKEPRGAFQTGNNVLHFPRVNLFEKQLSYFLQCIVNGCYPERNTVQESIYLMDLIDKVKRAGREAAT